MLTETDPRIAAKVNLYAVLGSLPLLTQLVPEAGEIIGRDPQPVAITFAVRSAGAATLSFADGELRFSRGRDNPTILLPFASAAAFNKVMDGKRQPVPVSGLRRIPFLLKVFAPLSKLLERYLRPSAQDMADPAFGARSTLLALRVMGAAIAEVANHDRSGQLSASQMPDGDLAIEVLDGPTLTLRVRDHRLWFLTESDQPPRAALTFSSLEVAGQLISGQLSAIAGVSDGRIAMRGMISMVDNLNRILDRVGDYLSD